MKNYTYGWRLREDEYIEIPVEEYTNDQWDMHEFVNGVLNNALKAANCGWEGVIYKVLSRSSYTREYMILYSNGDFNTNYDCGRWIPVTGNSKGCNLQVLGENLW
jgi:hypothetical protein